MLALARPAIFHPTLLLWRHPFAVARENFRMKSLLLSLTCVFVALLATSLAQDSPLDDKGRPVSKDPARSPAETAGQMEVPPGFRVELVAGEPDVVQPIAYTIDERGRLWVLENTNYPDSPGKPKDKVVVFEDADGDGKFEKRAVFWDKAPFSSGIAVGHGGVWIGAPPHLLFIPNRDGDTVPDGEPEVVLDGWAAEDTHETLNDFIWGPDGWLYGTHGIFTNSLVGKPGTPKAERIRIDAAVWRYHPTKKVFERWAEGGSNQWGIDWNDHGEAFFAACVIPHMWHGMEGARYQRQAGSHENPHTYEDIKTIAWGNYEKRAYCGAMVYLGGAFPPEWRDVFFFHDIHMNKLRAERLVRDGSGFRSERKADFMVSKDAWFRGLSPQYGPDGGVFITDWYDRVPCHQQRAYTDRSNGRIYKIVNDAVKPGRVDLGKASDAELVELQHHQNDWFVRQARRLLQERGPKPETTAALEKILLEDPHDTRQLRALWALHSQGALAEATALKALQAKSEHVRGWAVTLLAENGSLAAPVAQQLQQMSATDLSPLVRRRIASAAQRLPIAQRWPILDALARRTEDAKDRNLPLLLWYAAEGAVAAEPVQGVELLRVAGMPKLHEFIARRVTSMVGDEEKKAAAGLDALGKVLATAEAPMQRGILRGMLAAAKGRQQLPAPSGWEQTYAALRTSADSEVRENARTLALTFGSATALAELREIVVDERAKLDLRQKALESLALRRDPNSLEPLLKLASTPGPLRAGALRGLATFDDPRIAPLLIESYPKLEGDEKRETLNTLLARPERTRALLAAMDRGTLSPKELSAPLARIIQGFKLPEFDQWLEQKWGAIKTTSAEKQKEIERYKKFLGTDAILRADVKNGAAIFQRTCAVCHSMFGKGGHIGPELPGSYTDLDYLLQNLIDPNAVIGKDYQQTFIRTKNGQLHAGMVAGEEARSITLRTLGEPVVIARTDIESVEVSPQSMMPEGLLTALNEGEVRDLLLYLRQSKDPEAAQK